MARLANWIHPVAFLAMAGAVTLSRFRPGVGFALSLTCLLMIAAHPWRPGRPVLLAATLPIAAWMATRTPWTGLASAIILAGYVAFLAGDMVPLQWNRRAWTPLLVGVLAAVASAGILSRLATVDGVADALAFVVLLAAFRVAALSVAQLHGTYAMAVAFCVLPGAGIAGLMVGVVEAAATWLVVATPPAQRMSMVLGAPAGFVVLLLT